jgi:hypothetical protein
MKLPPHVLFFALPTLFVAGLFLVFLLVHGHPAPEQVPFQTPF